ncbi:MAG: phosphotransferase [Kiritimatiellae bacterium]|nr:phosphotransferase [Kiritimatiellia bacterium]
MKKIQKAVILAAGLGTRMRPLSFDKPKPMMPVWGKPLLGHALDLLQSWGVRQVLVNTHREPGPILAYLRQRPQDGLQVQISHEPALLGTGGMLARAAWFLDDSPFWLINADVAAELDPRPLLKTFRRLDALAVLWLHGALGPRTVEMQDGFITDFRSPRAGAPGTYTFCGYHLLSPQILEYLPKTPVGSIIRAYEAALGAGRRIAGVCVGRSYWSDAGTRERYVAVHEETMALHRAGKPGGRLFDPTYLQMMEALFESGVRIDGFVAPGPGARIAPGARIRNAVVWDDAVVEAAARLDTAVIGTRTRVRGRVSRVAVRADRLPDPQLAFVLRRMKWPVEHTTVVPFEPRGSSRSFTRLQKDDVSVILIRYESDRAENALYAEHARFLRRIGIQTPGILHHFPHRRMTVVEDLGDALLREVIAQSDARSAGHLYAQILEAVLTLHGPGSHQAQRRKMKLAPPFSARLYRWERRYFAEHFLTGHLRLPDGEVRGILRDLKEVAASLLQAPPTLIHRDLQSSNILLHNGSPAFVDFQGMRFGAAVYDLASLLCDPYVSLPLPLQIRLLNRYAERTADPAAVRALFWPAAVERLAQALGAFARLGALPGTERFLNFIPPAVAMMKRALEQIDGGLLNLRRILSFL